MKVTSNKSKRHYTITTGSGSVYRTTKMTKEEFEECDYNTDKDWLNYLKAEECVSL